MLYASSDIPPPAHLCAILESFPSTAISLPLPQLVRNIVSSLKGNDLKDMDQSTDSSDEDADAAAQESWEDVFGTAALGGSGPKHDPKIDWLRLKRQVWVLEVALVSTTGSDSHLLTQ